MSTKPDFQSAKDRPPIFGSTGIGRRRLLRAGISAAPVILAVSGRSAMAVPSMNDPNCPKFLSPMAWMSVAPQGTCVGVSHAVGQNTPGVSPGNWKPNVPKSDGTGNNAKLFTIAWPVGVDPFLGYHRNESYKGRAVATLPIDWTKGTKFSSIFGIGQVSETRSFSQILIEDAGLSSGTLQWFLCAAYLNALTFPTYALTTDEVKNIWNGNLNIPDVVSFLNQTWV